MFEIFQLISRKDLWWSQILVKDRLKTCKFTKKQELSKVDMLLVAQMMYSPNAKIPHIPFTFACP